jgi:hypothetical protein
MYVQGGCNFPPFRGNETRSLAAPSDNLSPQNRQGDVTRLPPVRGHAEVRAGGDARLLQSPYDRVPTFLDGSVGCNYRCVLIKGNRFLWMCVCSKGKGSLVTHAGCPHQRLRPLTDLTQCPTSTTHTHSHSLTHTHTHTHTHQRRVRAGGPNRGQAGSPAQPLGRPQRAHAIGRGVCRHARQAQRRDGRAAGAHRGGCVRWIGTTG